MKLRTFLLLNCLLLILGGCATNKHMYTADGKCITCWNNPITGQPINYQEGEGENTSKAESTTGTQHATTSTPVTQTASKKKESSYKEYKVSFSAPVNVDLAYIKIKREYNYYTDQETKQEYGRVASMKMQSFSYKYSATPSVHYNMRAGRDHDGVRAVIDHEIEKRSNDSSFITITYWLKDGTTNPTAFGESLKARGKKALNL